MTPSASLGLPSSLFPSIVTPSSTSSSRGTVSLSRVVFSFVLALNCLGVLAQPATPSSQQSLRLLSSEGSEWLHAFTTDRVEADMTNATNATSAIEAMASFITPDYVMALTTAFNATNGTAAIETMASFTTKESVVALAAAVFNATNGISAIQTVSSITRYLTALLTSGVGTPAPYVATPALAASASVVANVLNGTTAINQMALLTQEVAQALTTAFNATNGTAAIETPPSLTTKESVVALAAAVFNATNGISAIQTVSSITRYLTALLTSGVGTPAPYVATPALAASASVVANVLNGTSAIETMASFTQEVAQALPTAFNATTPVPLVSEGDRVAGYYNEMIGLAVALALVSIALIGLVVFILRTPHHGALPNLVANQGDPPADPQGGQPAAIEMQAALHPPVFHPEHHMAGQHLAQLEAQVVVGRGEATQPVPETKFV